MRRIDRLRDLNPRSDGVPTIMGHHDVKDTEHWLASPKREQVFGPLGVSNIRTFVNPDDPKKVGVLMDVADMDAEIVDDEARFISEIRLALVDIVIGSEADASPGRFADDALAQQFGDPPQG